MLRYLPLLSLMALAAVYERIRSAFTFVHQGCEWTSDWQSLILSIPNTRHIFAFGLLSFVALFTFTNNKTAKAVLVVFLFSVFIEIEQSFFCHGSLSIKRFAPKRYRHRGRCCSLLTNSFFTQPSRLRPSVN